MSDAAAWTNVVRRVSRRLFRFFSYDYCGYGILRAPTSLGDADGRVIVKSMECGWILEGNSLVQTRSCALGDFALIDEHWDVNRQCSKYETYLSNNGEGEINHVGKVLRMQSSLAPSIDRLTSKRW